MSKYWSLKDYRVKGFLSVAVLFLLFLLYLFFHRNVEETDNAVIRCDVTDVASEVRGVIKAINFSDNQNVNRGQPLIKLDDAAFQAARDKIAAELAGLEVLREQVSKDSTVSKVDSLALVEKTKASLDTAKSRMRTAEFEIREEQSNNELILARLESAESNLERAKSLFSMGYVSPKYMEDALREHRQAESAVRMSQARLGALVSKLDAERSSLEEVKVTHTQVRNSIDAKLGSLRASVLARQGQIEVARAELAAADINLARTNIKAPRSGEVTNRRVSVGQFVEIGQPLVSIASCAEKVWVEANFKETQIRKMGPGQPVSIVVDAYPGEVFTGRVESISNGSGSLFSVLPPENATGNFTKVVQRFPTLVTIHDGPKLKLRAGMSAVVEVKLTDNEMK